MDLSLSVVVQVQRNRFGPVCATCPAATIGRIKRWKFPEPKGGGVVNDGYCGWGLLPTTQAELGISSGMTDDPYYCSAKAYELYRMTGGFYPWTTYGWYTPGAGQTPITYY